jgi:hypothetical protein
MTVIDGRPLRAVMNIVNSGLKRDTDMTLEVTAY